MFFYSVRTESIFCGKMNIFSNVYTNMLHRNWFVKSPTSISEKIQAIAGLMQIHPFIPPPSRSIDFLFIIGQHDEAQQILYIYEDYTGLVINKLTSDEGQARFASTSPAHISMDLSKQNSHPTISIGLCCVLHPSAKLTGPNHPHRSQFNRIPNLKQ